MATRKSISKLFRDAYREGNQKISITPHTKFAPEELAELFDVDGLNRHKVNALDLSYSKIGDEGCSLVENVLMHVDCSLQELILEDNLIGKDGAKRIGTALAMNTTLKTLVLSSNLVGSSGAKYLGRGLSHNPVLIHLDLSGNDIGDRGAIKLAESLISNRSLKALFLSRNSIGNFGVSALAKLLVSPIPLETLDLHENAINFDGAKSIGLALGVNTSLRTLNLSVNAIGEMGAIFLSEGIGKNQGLNYLNLNQNGISAIGIRAIVEEMQSNGSLTCVNICYKNSLTRHEKETIAKAIEDITGRNFAAKKRLMPTSALDPIDDAVSPPVPSDRIIMSRPHPKDDDVGGKEKLKIRIKFHDGSRDALLSVPKNGTVADLRRVLPKHVSSSLAVRFSGVFLQDHEPLRYIPQDASVFLLPYPPTYGSGVRLVLKNLSGQIVDFEAFLGENSSSLMDRLADITGLSIVALQSMKIGGVLLKNDEMVSSYNFQNGTHGLIMTKRFKKISCISREEIKMQVFIQPESGAAIPIDLDPDDRLLMLTAKLSQMKDFRSIKHELPRMQFLGEKMSKEKTFREMGVRPGSVLDLPCKLERDLIVVLVKFLDCYAFYMMMSRSKKMGGLQTSLKKIPGMEFEIGKVTLHHKEMTTSQSLLGAEEPFSSGNVIYVPIFLPDGVDMPFSFYHYDMRVHVATKDGFSETFYVHSCDPIRIIHWIFSQMDEFRHQKVVKVTFLGTNLAPDVTFGRSGVRDGSRLEVFTKGVGRRRKR
eukprot:TRINITY_DN1437_c0_g1_i2.p1 TRINITY_DN1437_c0_g1~~TRINITY_DN1437_c0_g1_i2.p1  ORF type:complete len:763 (+),score=190.49 TRINITY_DN1437_c0_g1_i2:78-2366(+)